MIGIKNVSQMYSGVIEFQNLPETSYSILEKVVGMLNNGEDIEKILPASLETKSDGVSKDEAEKKKGSVKASGSSGKKPFASRKVFSDNETVYKIVKGIVDEAIAHPDQYEFRDALSREFFEAYSEKLKGCSVIKVSKVMDDLGYHSHYVYKDKKPMTMRKYPLPISRSEKSPKDEGGKPEEKNVVAASSVKPKRTWTVEPSEDQESSFRNWNMKQAGILRDSRMKCDMSITELSEIIGYPFYVIQKWESGTAAPSSAAMDVLEKRFGADFKSRIESAAGQRA